MTTAPQRVALVTGAARGIGLAVAKRFLAEGWRVALLDIEAELLGKSVEALAAPDRTLSLRCDVSDAKAVARAFAEIEAGSAGSMRWSTMPGSRCSRRFWKHPTPTGAGCWRSTSPGHSCAPRRPCH